MGGTPFLYYGVVPYRVVPCWAATELIGGTPFVYQGVVPCSVVPYEIVPDLVWGWVPVFMVDNLYDIFLVKYLSLR